MARKSAASSDTVNVACKLPTGLHIPVPNSRRVLALHGAHSPYAVAGHGITRGVSAADWAAIESTYADAAWLKSGHVFAHKTPESAADEAEERKNEISGFEPVDPRKPQKTHGLIQPDGAPDPGERMV